MVRGLVLVVDASCLFEVLAGTSSSRRIARRLAEDDDQVAPHVIDVEVLGVVRAHRLADRLDDTAAGQIVTDLERWRGERFPHQPLLRRAWELRSTVRGWDAMYVALAEALDAPLLTLDARLSRATGPRCRIETIG